MLDTAYAPSDVRGTLSVDATPLGWSGVEPGADVRIITRATTDGDLVTADGSTAGYLTGDGTSEAQATTTVPADGVERTIATTWHTGGSMTIDVDGDSDSAAYDGALEGAGTVEIAPTAAEIAVRNLVITGG